MRIIIPILAGCLLTACKNDASDFTYAAWGIGTSPTTQTVEIHNRDGSLLQVQHITLTPQAADGCTVSATMTADVFEPATGKTSPLTPGTVTIDFRKAEAMTFDWQPSGIEAEYFANPSSTPAWTPRKYLVPHITGNGAVCEGGGRCYKPNDPVAFIADTSVTPEQMLAAFNRVKEKCPSP